MRVHDPSPCHPIRYLGMSRHNPDLDFVRRIDFLAILVVCDSEKSRPFSDAM